MANENFLNLPQQLAAKFQQEYPGFWGWLTDLNEKIGTKFATLGDVTVLTPGKGIVLTNAAGTITKRIRLSDAGTGFIIEDV